MFLALFHKNGETISFFLNFGLVIFQNGSYETSGQDGGIGKNWVIQEAMESIFGQDVDKQVTRLVSSRPASSAAWRRKFLIAACLLSSPMEKEERLPLSS